MNANIAMKEYRHNDLHGGVAGASPHKLVKMLMDGALEKILAAKGFMAAGNIARKGEQISWAISIIDGLRSCLDKELGGEFAENLSSLYDYMERRLLQANLENDAKILDEVGQLLIEVKLGWDAIPEEHHFTTAD